MNKNNSNKGDILIVDDVPENLQLLFTMLTEQGYEVRRVLNGKQAINAAITEPPDLILLDIKMPDLDGYQVCEELKKHSETKEIPVIFLSALNDAFDKVKAFDVGGVDYITKPFQLQEVLVRVENQLKLMKMQRELQEKNRYLSLLNKELEAFSYRVHHDLCNPLTQANGFIFLLKEKYTAQLDERGQKYIQAIYEAGLRMEEIVDDLLRLSHAQYSQLVFESIDLSKMVEEIIQKLQEKQGKRDIEFVVAPGLTAEADRRLLKIALENLLGNAYKYTGKKEQARIEFGLLHQDGSQVYFVRDNGVGFDAEKGEEIFAPFTRLHSQEDFAGTGIGLATVKRIIELHGGRIWSEGHPNQGATFYFTLEQGTVGSLSGGHRADN